MAVSAGTRLAPSAFIPDETQHRRQIAAYLREVHQGHIGNVGNLTLSINSATTPVKDFRAGFNSFIGFTPLTANAAAELGAGTMYVSSRSAEGFTVTHANTATADRTFVYCILG